jgi:hypothetical protein
MSLSSKFCAGTKKDKNPCTRKASVGLFCKIHSKVKPNAYKENDENDEWVVEEDVWIEEDVWVYEGDDIEFCDPKNNRDTEQWVKDINGEWVKV